KKTQRVIANIFGGHNNNFRPSVRMPIPHACHCVVVAFLTNRFLVVVGHKKALIKKLALQLNPIGMFASLIPIKTN
ncbi:MAG TPA: hypothetical protein VGE32_13835, partial [Cellvibrio sp.]